MSINITVPDLGEGIADAQFAGWLQRDGDVVAEGDEIAEVMTDKANVAIVSPASGVLTALSAAVDDVVKIGQVIAVIEVQP